MRSTSIIASVLGVLVFTIGLVPSVASAEGSERLPDGMERRLAALAAIDVDPWELPEEEIPERREPVIAYERHVRGIASETAAARAEAEEELASAELVLEGAEQHRAAMEAEVEGYSISMWILGDLGLQELYDSEAERARQHRPVIAVTEALIERVEAADAAIVDAQAEVDAHLVVVAERVAADDLAQRELRQAEQIRERFDAVVTARVLAIDRLTHELLTEERPQVPLVTITSVTVQLPIETPATPVAPNGEQAAGPEAVASSMETGSAPHSEVETRPVTVTIPPIVVNAGIAGQVQALIGAARSDGIDLHGSGFRPREDQITLRLAHCGSSGYDIFDRPAGECSPPTARPGASEHELGLAVDFTENGEILTWGSPGYQWMVANGASFGLLNLPSEAWHWSTTGS